MRIGSPDALNTSNIAHSPMQHQPISNEEIDRRNAEIEPVFRGWKREAIDHRMRPSGFKQREGCGHWQINCSMNAEPCNLRIADEISPNPEPDASEFLHEAAQAFVKAMNNHPEAVPNPTLQHRLPSNKRRSFATHFIHAENALNAPLRWRKSSGLVLDGTSQGQGPQVQSRP